MQDRFKGHDSFPGKTEQKVHEAWCTVHLDIFATMMRIYSNMGS
jgi:hypothetical protein